jgi:3-deoxy-manno-octulosonate cytidylyltransferase (CMP-KDO synthetase)
MDIDTMLEKFINSESDVGTLITKITCPTDLQDKGCVKVVLDENQNALFFSRCPIPFNRDSPINEWLKHYIYWKHIGIYAYKLDALKQFVSLPISTLETVEKLEQLRLLERGTKFLCVETKSKLIGVDTQEDLEKVRAELIK